MKNALLQFQLFLFDIFYVYHSHVPNFCGICHI